MESNKKYTAQDALNTFFIESEEMLAVAESSLLDIEKTEGNEDSEDTLNALFRAAHTLKGSSGMFGFIELESFCHVAENLLDQVRKGNISMDSEMISLLLECHDFVKIMLSLAHDPEKKADDELLQTQNKLKASLDKYIVSSEQVSPEGSKIDDAALGDILPQEDKKCCDMNILNDCWHISLRFFADLFRNSLDPQSFISYLDGLGEIIHIIAIKDAIPPIEKMDPESCYLGFEIDFRGDVTKERIEDVFEFLMDDCDLRIVPPESNITEYVELIQQLPESPMRVGEILQQIGTLTEAEIKKVLSMQKDQNSVAGEFIPEKLMGEILVEEQMVQKSVLKAAIEKQQITKTFDDKSRDTIRVNALKLDNLINLVGELVITSANVRQLVECSSDRELLSSVSVMSRLIEEIRDSTMNVRMVQIGETFKRFERIIRDLCRDRGKKIELVINGGDTELDKTLVEQITDPLMHLVRNAVDHGIESPQERIAKGKPEKGTVHLDAHHETGSIVIEIKDDGQGLNREKILAKAIDRGLVQHDQQINDDELFQVIFEAGFSTADKVSNISGRGVGMDVVRQNIESLRGSVVLMSKENEGTTIRIHLPLTLAIIDGFLVKVGDFSYVLPLDMVVECTDIIKEDLNHKDGGNFINLRGDVLPFLRLRDFFSEESEAPELEKIIVVESTRKKIGLVVDRLMGEFQTVVKPLGEIFHSLQWVSGSTILGTGEVALILDVPKLIQKMQYSVI